MNNAAQVIGDRGFIRRPLHICFEPDVRVDNHRGHRSGHVAPQNRRRLHLGCRTRRRQFVVSFGQGWSISGRRKSRYRHERAATNKEIDARLILAGPERQRSRPRSQSRRPDSRSASSAVRRSPRQTRAERFGPHVDQARHEAGKPVLAQIVGLCFGDAACAIFRAPASETPANRQRRLANSSTTRPETTTTLRWSRIAIG